ncbi:MAG: radical SAM protein [Eubacteriales bacterium]
MKKNINFPHVFFMPTTGCMAKCIYCFAPVSAEKMNDATLKKTINWIKTSADLFYKENYGEFDEKKPPFFRFTYHGGEPLLMGKKFIKESLELLDSMEIPFRKHLSIQSNLWLLDQEYCEMFKRYEVNVGTSLDGPEELTDIQRGKGYFQKTMNGIDLLRKNGIPVSCICTFTKNNAPYFEKVYKFFEKENLNFKFFMVQPTMDKEIDSRLYLTYEEQSELVINLLDYYLLNPGKIKVPTLDILGLSLTTRMSGGFVQGGCIGKQLAIGSDGGIYNCQLFVGHEKYKWGSVYDTDSLQDMHSKPGWKEFQNWQSNLKHICRDCSYGDICQGGCIYNSIMADGETLDLNKKDPHCGAYRKAMDRVNILQEQAMALSEPDCSSLLADCSAEELAETESFRRLLKAFWKNRSSL